MSRDDSGAIDILDRRDLHLQVKDSILEYVRRNALGPHQRLPTHRDFGRMYDVSPLTVQRAVSALAEDNVVYTRRGRGTFVLRTDGSVPAARRRSALVACVVPTIQSNTVAATVLALDDQVFDRRDEHIIVANTNHDEARELRLLGSLLERRIDALVYQPWAPMVHRPGHLSEVDARLQRFLTQGTPVILLDEFAIPHRYDTIIPDDTLTTDLAVRHLAALGHRRLIFFGHSEYFANKIKAFHTAVRDAGLSDREYRIVPHDEEDPENTDCGSMPAVLEEGWEFTGVVAATDQYALTCLRLLGAAGIRCPRDVSVVGADNLEAIEHIERPLTTVWCPPRETAAQVLRLNTTRQKGESDLREVEPCRILMSPMLLERGTTARYDEA